MEKESWTQIEPKYVFNAGRSLKSVSGKILPLCIYVKNVENPISNNILKNTPRLLNGHKEISEESAFQGHARGQRETIPTPFENR
jgi:hypothetical protein